MRSGNGLSIWVTIIAAAASGCSTVRRGPPSGEVSSPIESISAAQVPSDTSPESQAAYHFSLGQSYGLEGNNEKAIEEYKMALLYDPNSAVIHTRLATEYVKRGLLTFAIEECKNSIKLDPKYTDARLLLAGLYGATKLVNEALQEYDAVLTTDTKNTEAHKEVYVFKGSLLLEEGRSKEALDTLRKLTQLNPDSFLGYYYIGRAYSKLGDTENATKSFRKSLAIKPEFNQAALGLGMLFEEKGRTADAIKVYEKFLSDARDVQIATRLAQIHLDRSDYKNALKALELLDQLEDDNLNVKVKIGLIHVELKHYKQAARVFIEILARNNEAERVRFYLGSVYEELREFDKAIEVFKQIAPDSASFGDAAVHVGYLYKMKGDSVMAREWIDKAIVLNPELPQYHTFRASLIEEATGPQAALSELELVSSRFEKDERLLYYMGSLYEKTGKQEKAVQIMKKILEVNPDNVNALNYIGYTLASRGEELDSAEGMIRRAVALRPDDGYIQDSLGYILLRRGRLREAIVELEKAYRMKPTEPVISEHLGDAYARHNLRVKALQKYNEASKLYSDPTEKSKVEKKIDELQANKTSRLPANKAE